MTKKPLKSIRTLASDLKARRKPKFTTARIKRANKIFEMIEMEQSLMRDESARIGKIGAAKKITGLLKEIRNRPLSKRIFDIVDRYYEKTKS